MAIECKCKGEKKERSVEEKKLLLNRISRIEGQVRAVKRMIEEDSYCPEVIVQISAASSALGSLSRLLLTTHINTCVLDKIKRGDDSAALELAELIERLNK